MLFYSHQITERLNTFESFKKQLYAVNDDTFENIALAVFRSQASNNLIYKQYIQNLGLKNVSEISSALEIPFMPISFFKNHSVKTGAWQSDHFFSTSGTSGQTTGVHHILDMDFYIRHAERCFNHFFGKLTDYHFLALLPSYLERKNSSLVAMMEYFITASKSEFSGFYLNNTDQLLKDVENLKNDGRKTIVWGVTFALMDLAEHEKPDFSHCMVFETGGMKGRRKEVIRHELHEVLKKGLNLHHVYSEYGMTELLSQAYTDGTDHFVTPPWMKIIGREVTDPLHKGLLHETSGINVIDLANWHSVAFIETEDLGKVRENNSFEVLGRMDNSDVRGCNLMVE